MPGRGWGSALCLKPQPPRELLHQRRSAEHDARLAVLLRRREAAAATGFGDQDSGALAMLQIEQANIRAQLKEAQEQKAVLENINPSLSPAVIVNGSLVKTDKGYLFISTALGKAVITGINVIALSQLSPLGIKLMGLSKGEAVEINGNQYLIESIE